MRTWEWSAIGTGIVAGLILTAGALAADPSREEPAPASTWGGGSLHSSNWFKGMFGSSDKKTSDKEPGVRVGKAADKETVVETKPNTEADRAASERGREQATLLRRIAVCDQLKLIAYHKNDDALLHRAEELEERAQALYAERISHLPASKARPALKDSAAGKEEEPAKRSENVLHSTSLPSVKKTKDMAGGEKP